MKSLKQFISEIINKKENSIPVDYDFIANKLFYWDELIGDYGSWDDIDDSFDENNNPETILQKFLNDKVTANTMKVYVMPYGMDYIKPSGVKENQVNIVSKSKYEVLIKQFTWKSLIDVYYDWKVEVSEDNNAIHYCSNNLEDVNYLIIFE